MLSNRIHDAGPKEGELARLTASINQERLFSFHQSPAVNTRLDTPPGADQVRGEIQSYGSRIQPGFPFYPGESGCALVKSKRCWISPCRTGLPTKAPNLNKSKNTVKLNITFSYFYLFNKYIAEVRCMFSAHKDKYSVMMA